MLGGVGVGLPLIMKITFEVKENKVPVFFLSHHKNKGTLFSSTFEVEENKVPGLPQDDPLVTQNHPLVT